MRVLSFISLEVSKLGALILLTLLLCPSFPRCFPFSNSEYLGAIFVRLVLVAGGVFSRLLAPVYYDVRLENSDEDAEKGMKFLGETITCGGVRESGQAQEWCDS